jgi:Flp pilus assembly protein TadG
MLTRLSLRQWLRGRFARDQRGLAAVEFALLAPIMILLYCGLGELTLAMMAERQAAHSASVVGDLVAQTPTMDATQMADIFNVGSSIMKPFPAAPLKVRVTSIKADALGVPHVVWSQGHGMGAMTTGATVPGFPAGLLLAGDSIIEADVSYTFTSPIEQVVAVPIGFGQNFYFKPRRSADVTWGP